MGQKFRKHGIRASHTAEVILDDVRVPGRCLVGDKEKLDRRLARVREGAAAGHGVQTSRGRHCSRPWSGQATVGPG